MTAFEEEVQPISFARDYEGLMEFSRIKQGPHKGDWINVGCANMPLSFIIRQDGVYGGRQVLCAVVAIRTAYRVVAIGEGSLKDAREWCTANTANLNMSLGAGGAFKVATLVSSGFGGGRRKSPKSEQSEIERLEKKVADFEKVLAQLKAKLTPEK